MIISPIPNPLNVTVIRRYGVLKKCVTFFFAKNLQKSPKCAIFAK